MQGNTKSIVYWPPIIFLTCNDGARLFPSYLYYTVTAIPILYWHLVHTHPSHPTSPYPWPSLHPYYAQECSAKEFTAPPIAHSYTTWLGGIVGKPGAWPMGNANQYLYAGKVGESYVVSKAQAHTGGSAVEYQVTFWPLIYSDQAL